MNKNKIIIGTAQSDINYGIIKSKNFIHLSNFVKKNNFFLDTAPVYRNSDRFFKKIGPNYKKIISKIPFIKEEEKFEKSFKKNIEKIYTFSNSKKIYGILLHDPSILQNKTKRTIIFKKIKELKKKKLLKKFGVSVYSTIELKKILKIFKPEIVQLPINILNQTFLENNLLKTLKKKKIEIHGRSIFLQGLLILNYNKIPKNFKNNKALVKFFKFIENTKISSLEHCIKFIQNIKEIDKYVVGFNSLAQLKQFLECLKNINQINANKKIYDSLKSKDLKLIDPRKWNSDV
tara:strand:- start:259 stop:1128 length:870 start_codon:yes stop_codon:yes gene_type:complete